ncbi:MAG: ABC transporter permease [Methylococcaceae bacterium]|nr:ABC transporter permease [Methylococcaceae bacterium]
MNSSIMLKLALNLIRRDWRSGELTILVAALIIAVAGTTAISLFGHRLTRTMETQAAEFLASDLSVGAHEPPAEDWTRKADELGLTMARTVEFPSVLVENGEMLLTGAKAVSATYPLRGTMRTADGSGETEKQEAPEPDSAWVDRRVLISLKLSLGDFIHLGEKKLKITRIILHEPDRRGDLYSLSPRVMFNLADLEAAGLIRTGSNAHYYALFAGDEKRIREFRHWLKPQLNPGQKLVDIHQDRPELGNALSRAERYLGLSSTVIVLIAGVAIAMGARRHTERHFDLTAMLKCLGAREREVVQIHLAQYLILGLAASLAGCLLGYLAQEAVVWQLKGILPHTLSAPAWYAPLFGLTAGLFILLGFALPPVLRLKRLPPLRVLRRDLAPLPASAWLVYGLALATLTVLIWLYTGDGAMTAIVLGISLGVLAIAGLGVLALLKTARRLLPFLGLSWRFGLQNLTRNPRLGMSQILAFGLTLTAMLVSLLARTELIGEWRRQLPPNTPNYFALNLFESELPAFRDFLAQRHIVVSDFYPIVRGRLTAVNGVDVHIIAHKDSPGEGAINRDLSLTWSVKPLLDNRLVKGEWWGSEPVLGRVSVEAELAKSLRIRLGDTLTFNIAGEEKSAVVDSLRSVRWDTLRPNFYMIFSPGSLQGFPATWLTSFHLPSDQKPELVGLVKSFPAVTILEVDPLLKQFQTILKEISLAIEFMLAFALAAGFAVLFAAVRATLDERIREDALLRALGASRNLLRKSLAVEFIALGLLSGLLAASASEAIAWGLFSYAFELIPRFHWEIWLAAPLLGALAVGLSGYLHTRAVTRVSPIVMLREM